MEASALPALRDVAIVGEPDRYLAATLAPASLRYDLIALSAFAAEIGRIPDQVREPLAGEIRLQWWRDAVLSTVSDSAAGHPVAKAMRETIARHALPRETVELVIDSQSDILHGEVPPDAAALQSRLAAGEGSLFELAARICDASTPEMAGITQAAGIAYGLSRALARGPHDESLRTLIPHAVLSPAENTTAAEGDLRENPSIKAALDTLRDIARKAFSEATGGLTSISRRQRVAFLPLAMVRPNLGALETGIRRDPARTVAPLMITRLLRIGWAHVSGRF